MALDLILWQADTVFEYEGQNGNYKTVQEEISEQTDADSADDEESTRSPGKSKWLWFDHCTETS